MKAAVLFVAALAVLQLAAAASVAEDSAAPALSTQQLKRVDTVSARLSNLHTSLTKGFQDVDDRIAKYHELLKRLEKGTTELNRETKLDQEKLALAHRQDEELRAGLKELSGRQAHMLEVQRLLSTTQQELSRIVKAPWTVSPLDLKTLDAPVAPGRDDTPDESTATAHRPLSGLLAADMFLVAEGRYMNDGAYDMHPAPRLRLHLREGGAVVGEARFVALPHPELVVFTGHWTDGGVRVSIRRASHESFDVDIKVRPGTDKLVGTFKKDTGDRGSMVYHATVLDFPGHAAVPAPSAAPTAITAAPAPESSASPLPPASSEHAHAESSVPVPAPAPAQAPTPSQLEAGTFTVSGFTALGADGPVLSSPQMYLKLAAGGQLVGVARYSASQHLTAATTVLRGTWASDRVSFAESFAGQLIQFDGTVSAPGRLSGRYTIGIADKPSGQFEFTLATVHPDVYASNEERLTRLGDEQQQEEEVHGGGHVVVDGSAFHLPDAPSAWDLTDEGAGAAGAASEASSSAAGPVEADDVTSSDKPGLQLTALRASSPDEGSDEVEADVGHTVRGTASRVLGLRHLLRPVDGQLTPGFYKLSGGRRVDAETDVASVAPEALVTLHADGTMSGEEGDELMTGDWSDRIVQWVQTVRGKEFTFTGVSHPSDSTLSGSFAFDGGAGSGTFSFVMQHVSLMNPPSDLLDHIKGVAGGESGSSIAGKPKTLEELLANAKLAMGDVTSMTAKANRPSSDDIIQEVTEGKPAVAWTPSKTWAPVVH